MTLAFGLNFVDLNNLQGLRKLDEIFLNFLSSHSYSLYQTILSLRANPDQVDQKYYSEFLLEISPIFDDFLAELFGIEQEIANIRFSHKEFDIIYECKRKFVQRIAVKKYPHEKLQEIDFTSVANSLEKLLGVGYHPSAKIGCHSCVGRDIDSRLRGNDKETLEVGYHPSAKIGCHSCVGRDIDSRLRGNDKETLEVGYHPSAKIGCHSCVGRDIDSRLRGNDKETLEVGCHLSAKIGCHSCVGRNPENDFTNKFARQVIEWQLDAEKHAFELDIAAQYAAFMVYNIANPISIAPPLRGVCKHDEAIQENDDYVDCFVATKVAPRNDVWRNASRVSYNIESQLFSLPKKIDKDNLIDPDKVAKYRNHPRIGFDYLDSTSNLDTVLNNTHYCIYCHKQEKDSCSKGLLSAMSSKSGCPLKQKISEMNYVKSKGFNLAALAIIIIDNPMVAATGHRICNDCSNACIYQKQEAVDIPLVESNILETTLLLPYGVEIYLLLTNWNPLNIFAPLPNPPTNYKVLVVGQGPAGFSLSHYLLRDGHDVVAIDGLKITPLPFDISKPIKYWSDYKENLSEKIPGGFGGVVEYGITPRWDKNNLTILRLILQRNDRFKLFGGVSLGSNITMEQAFHLGFDHVAWCVGAGKPKIVEMRNFLAKGVRTASDFLMTLQSGGAFLEQSTTNLLIRMPIVIIGGGLTAIDAATESLNYYKLQVEKFLKKYQFSVEKNGKKHTEQHWTNEDRLIAEEFILHAKLFRQAQNKQAIKQILDELGGVTIYYRGKLKDSPAYKLNPEEVMYAMGAGVKFVENMIALGIDIDQYNYAKSIEFDNLGVRKNFKARTILMAIGIDKEGVNNCLEDNVTYFGDCNPLYSGSVVKAIASSKEGYKNIRKKLIKNSPNFPGSYVDFFAKLDYLLMSRIEEVNILSDKIVELVIHSPLAAHNFQPGQFFRLQNYSSDISKIIEPLAVAGAYVDSEKGLIHLIVWQNGKSSKLCRYLSKNEQVVLMGPNGKPTEILKDSNIVLVGGGVGNAVLCSMAKALKKNNCKIIYFVGYKNLQDRFYQEKIEESADIVVWCCEEGILSKNRSQDISVKGDLLYAIMGYCYLWKDVTIDRIIAAGVSEMMQAIRDIKDDFFGKKPQLIVSINSPMQCMMKGICGQCVQKVTDENRYIFTCACQEQDAKIVDFTGLKSRLEQNSLQEKL